MNYTRILLTIIPFIWTIGLIPLANRVKPIVFGLPFLAFWLSFGIYVTFVCVFLLYKYDERRRQGDQNGQGGRPNE
jgi:uncharacterized membrane protein